MRDDDNDDEGELWHYVEPVSQAERYRLTKFVLALFVWGLLCVFAAGVCGLCVRLFHLAAYSMG